MWRGKEVSHSSICTWLLLKPVELFVDQSVGIRSKSISRSIIQDGIITNVAFSSAVFLTFLVYKWTQTNLCGEKKKSLKVVDIFPSSSELNFPSYLVGLLHHIVAQLCCCALFHLGVQVWLLIEKKDSKYYFSVDWIYFRFASI